ncbi:hypothetical protein ACGFIW_25680 [Micromonospora sp. NPDC048935]|uniref:hypothetical protein n=1 Tax=Micromonospora sp. NPDC048935 TaxID=3364262 RepID=UPI00370FD526
MRGKLLVGVALTVTVGAGCTPSVERLAGDAGPAGPAAGSASPSVPGAPTTASSGSGTPAAGSTSPAAPVAGTSGPDTQVSAIRQTDWPNAVIRKLGFCGESDDSVAFRNGSNGFDVPCRILPGGAQPVYGEFIVEEPANAPSTEDALVLVELGNPNAARRQALVPVQLSDNGRGRYAWPVIRGDQPGSGGAQVMTFASYRLVGQNVEATVRTLDGGTETRRWRKADGSGNWERY